LTEQIVDVLLELLERQGGAIQIQRNSLADCIGCVPSQISYVISTRFTKEKGYMVESRRGGGGFIRIERVDCRGPSLIMHVINSIGCSLEERSARAILEGLCGSGSLSEAQGRLMLSAVADGNFSGLPEEEKRRVRANVLKSLLITAAV